jgi:hypothetical protein
VSGQVRGVALHTCPRSHLSHIAALMQALRIADLQFSLQLLRAKNGSVMRVSQ